MSQEIASMVSSIFIFFASYLFFPTQKGLIVKDPDNGILVDTFEFHSRYSVHFRKCMKPPYSLAIG